MDNAILAFKDTVGFCINLSDEWFYEGQIVNIILNEENHSEHLKSVVIKSVHEYEKVLTLERFESDGTSFNVNIEDIEKIELLERRKINRRKTERY